MRALYSVMRDFAGAGEDGASVLEQALSVMVDVSVVEAVGIWCHTAGNASFYIN